MILVMQRTLNEERKDFFENRPDLDERELSEREKSRLKRFYHKQGSLAELFDTLFEAKVLSGDGRNGYHGFRAHSALGFRAPARETIQPLLVATRGLT